MRAPRVPSHERGYAMVAAVAGIALMATMAMSVVALTTPQLGALQAEMDRARLAAAADAGINVALDGLTSKSITSRWTLEGEVHAFQFDGVALQVHIEDEHGKIMLNRIGADNMGWLLEAIGLQGADLEIARDSFADWTDQDDEPRENGAESEYYDPRGLKARNDIPQTIDELGDIRGFTPQLIDRFRRFATVDTGEVPFDAHYASPLAIRVMTDGVADSPLILQRQRVLAGQRTAIGWSGAALKKPRTVSVIAVATAPDGSTLSRRALARVALPGKQRWTINYIE